MSILQIHEFFIYMTNALEDTAVLKNPLEEGSLPETGLGQFTSMNGRPYTQVVFMQHTIYM